MTPTISNKQLIVRNTLLLYVRQLVTLVIALYTSRLTLQILGVSDFGIYSAVGGVTAILSVITSSMSASTQRFMTFSLGSGNKERLIGVFRTSMQIHFMLCVIFMLIAETAGMWFLLSKMTIPPERLDIAIWVFQCSILNCVLNFLNVPYNAAVVAHEDMGLFAMFSILQSFLLLLTVALLSFISWDKLLLYAIFQMVVFTLMRLITIYFCKRRYEEVNRQYYLKTDIPLMKEMFGMTGWVVLSNAALAGFTQGINLLFNVFLGPIVNAAYTVAMQAYSGIRSFTSSFQLASNPQIVKLYSSGNLAEMNKLLYLVCKLSLFLVFFLSLPFVLYRYEILSLWLGEVPQHADNFFLLLFIFAYIDVIAYPMDIAAQATGQLKGYTICTTTILLMALPIGYILLKLGCPPEAVYVGAIGIAIIGVGARIYRLNKQINLSILFFLNNVIIPSVFVMVSSIIASVVLKHCLHNYYAELLHFFITFGVTGMFIYIFGMSKNERQYVIVFIMSKLGRKKKI